MKRLTALLAASALALAACSDSSAESRPENVSESATATQTAESSNKTEAPETEFTPSGDEDPNYTVTLDGAEFAFSPDEKMTYVPADELSVDLKGYSIFYYTDMMNEAFAPNTTMNFFRTETSDVAAVKEQLSAQMKMLYTSVVEESIEPIDGHEAAKYIVEFDQNGQQLQAEEIYVFYPDGLLELAVGTDPAGNATVSDDMHAWALTVKRIG